MGDFASWDSEERLSPSEDEVFVRPSASSIRGAWKDLFSDPLLSLSRLRGTALSKAGLGDSDPDGGVLLRSIYWRFYHGLLPPPTSLDLFVPSLQASRENYQKLRERYLRAPDGRWADDCTGADECRAGTTSSVAGPSRRSVQHLQPSSGPGTTYDPLSLDEDSPWKVWYAHLETRRVIMQDVDRTFPDIPYFALERVRRCMVTMLFLFTVLNPDVGYRQGMHELLAVCLLMVDRDSIVPDSGAHGVMEDAMQCTLDRRYIEHDAFDVFMALMKSAKTFYEWKQEEGPRRAQGVQAPIVARCNNLHSSLLRRIDPQLWEKLENEGVEAQLWAMKWYKLIFTRELPFEVALRLWDGIFAEDPGLGILDFIAAAMVLLIRNELLESDHAGLLTNLLRYPAPSPTYPFSPSLILSQALLLRNNVSPTTGVEVVIQNHEILGISAQPPVREVLQSRPVQRRPPQRGVQGLAAGLYERAQAAGLDRAILSTVADIRRNIPDSAYSYLPNLPFSPSPTARDPISQFSSIPSSAPVTRSNTTSHQAAPPLTSTSSTDTIASAKSLVEAERQLAELRLAMVGMGKAMSEILDRLPEGIGKIETKGLEDIKDTLLDAGGRDVEAMVKQWAWHDGLETASSRATTPGPMEDEPHSVPLTKDIGTRPVTAGIDPSQRISPDSPSMSGITVFSPNQRSEPDLTPTPTMSARFEQPWLPTPRLSLASRLHQASSSAPSTPKTSPWAPQSPPHTAGPPRPRQSLEGRSTSGVSPRLTANKKPEKEFTGSIDPLAGLGISAQPNGGAQRKPKGGDLAGPDPLGVGLA